VDHQPAQEEADEERRAQLDAALVRGGRARETEEEEKAAEKQRRVVRVGDVQAMNSTCTAVTHPGTGRSSALATPSDPLQPARAV
jgi:hypothetical protein